MESLNFFKGYGKVKPSEDPNSLPNQQKTIPQKPCKIIAITLTVLLTLIIGAIVGAVIHESVTEPPESEELASNSAESLKTVCAVTRYPDSCFSSISSLNKPLTANPLNFFNLSLQATVQELSNLTSLPKELISKSNDKPAESALKDCVGLFDDAVSQLNRSFELMKVGPGEKVLTDMKISDIQTWISAAMTDQDTCLEGIGEMGSTVPNEFKVKVQTSQESMSNSLAILNNIQSLFEKFGLTMP
ncbi:putative pectinesterase/pectinesterase inhibitor 26 [Olea europaea var. sylvestris]|uniref:pectinesterase n=1 Tax=Olea europaea subsp. europaea TaxID=158383 RepID=A0A8S0UAD2_OLEEU|nr:putative pectinesterase/pectinesterase inhibitor 26 [Olea europaea var. sylvestris]CAA3014460.1 pectinesterase pectinesterase inhibitor 26 [Olea europaea subsp. europaea]